MLRLSGSCCALLWSFLDARSVLTGCQCVCSAWRRLAREHPGASRLCDQAESALVLGRRFPLGRWRDSLTFICASTPRSAKAYEAVYHKERGLLHFPQHGTDDVLVVRGQRFLEKLAAFRARWIESYGSAPHYDARCRHSLGAGCLGDACDDWDCLVSQRRAFVCRGKQCAQCGEWPSLALHLDRCTFPLPLEPAVCPDLTCRSNGPETCRRSWYFCDKRCAWQWMMTHALRDTCGHIVLPCVHAYEQGYPSVLWPCGSFSSAALTCNEAHGAVAVSTWWGSTTLYCEQTHERRLLALCPSTCRGTRLVCLGIAAW